MSYHPQEQILPLSTLAHMFLTTYLVLVVTLQRCSSSGYWNLCHIRLVLGYQLAATRGEGLTKSLELLAWLESVPWVVISVIFEFDLWLPFIFNQLRSMDPTLVSEHFQRRSPHSAETTSSLVRIASVEVCKRELELHGTRFLNLNLQRVKILLRRNPVTHHGSPIVY